MTAVRFERRGDMHAVTFIYNADLVELLKRTIPSHARKWVPARREWHIESAYAKQFADTVRGIGHTVLGLEEPRRGHDTDPTLWARLLFQRVGPTRSSAVYRALSKCLHPDIGGDTELQRELNAAHAELSTRQWNARAS
jgi:hypothetical protein